jgi:hypothetical protein
MATVTIPGPFPAFAPMLLPNALAVAIANAATITATMTFFIGIPPGFLDFCLTGCFPAGSWVLAYGKRFKVCKGVRCVAVVCGNACILAFQLGQWPLIDLGSNLSHRSKPYSLTNWILYRYGGHISLSD